MPCLCLFSARGGDIRIERVSASGRRGTRVVLVGHMTNGSVIGSLLGLLDHADVGGAWGRVLVPVLPQALRHWDRETKPEQSISSVRQGR